ncbi:hypothetical protein CPLU01_15883 [Colletotrichum plurivorum]|uniref:Uncharacterized protein n=1 Tax=Colletotrichum plurivorum TaxID=2175906 RepID=A0A8H6J5H1_9PEZI|nr:hypothetical protein CPLU01_15883 [Colletotrichum plurivorum]
MDPVPAAVRNETPRPSEDRSGRTLDTPDGRHPLAPGPDGGRRRQPPAEDADAAVNEMERAPYSPRRTPSHRVSSSPTPSPTASTLGLAGRSCNRMRRHPPRAAVPSDGGGRSSRKPEGNIGRGGRSAASREHWHGTPRREFVRGNAASTTAYLPQGAGNRHGRLIDDASSNMCQAPLLVAMVEGHQLAAYSSDWISVRHDGR